MANKRSDKFPYPSKYGVSRWVSAAQFLAEIMCERRARQEKRVLPVSFWNKDEFWKSYFVQQVTAANRLMNRLDPEKKGTGAKALSLFLRGDRGKTCTSLSPGWLVPIVEEIHRGVVFRQEVPVPVEPKQEPAPQEEVVVTKAEVREAFAPRQSVLSKLED